MNEQNTKAMADVHTQRSAFLRYLADCDKNAIHPDAAGAFNWAWTNCRPSTQGPKPDGVVEALPPLPEPDGWIGANDHDPDAGVPAFTADTIKEYACLAITSTKRTLSDDQITNIFNEMRMRPSQVRGEFWLEYARALLRHEAAGGAVEGAEWCIDHSAGRPILTFKNCSVIEAEQADYVLRLIAQDEAASTGSSKEGAQAGGAVREALEAAKALGEVTDWLGAGSNSAWANKEQREYLAKIAAALAILPATPQKGQP